MRSSVSLRSVQSAYLTEKAPWYHDPDALRITSMMFFTGGFFFVELIYGATTGSLALISDAFHMLSDFFALMLGFMARRASKEKTNAQYTFGLARAEIVGGLMNGVFLLAVCFFIGFESIQRFVDPPEIEDGVQVIIVASIGLGINLAGIFIFHEHGHGHDHGHDHEHGHGHGHNHKKDQKVMSTNSDPESGYNTLRDDASVAESYQTYSGAEGKPHKHINLNMHGVFLHILGDLLGSIGVLISGCIIEFTDLSWKDYVDPLASILISIIMLQSTLPLVKRCSAILLQGVPDYINLHSVMTKLSAVSGVIEIHEFHVWQLINSRLVASVHVVCLKDCDFMLLASKLQTILHNAGIHSATIQPEFVLASESSNGGCILACNVECVSDRCCDE